MSNDIIDISFDNEYLPQKVKPRIVVTKDELPTRFVERRIVLPSEPPTQPSDDDSGYDFAWYDDQAPLIVRFARSMVVQILLACLFGGALAWIVHIST